MTKQIALGLSKESLQGLALTWSLANSAAIVAPR